MSCNVTFSLTSKPTVIKGENTASFYRNFLMIDFENPDNIQISKAEFKTGEITKTYNNPVFPLPVNFKPEESKKLNNTNIGYLVLYDNQNRPFQCPGYCEFYAKNGAFCYA